MPITTIKIVRGIFTEEQKSAMIQEVTEAMVKVTGEEKRNGNWVLIEETNPGEWAIGGNPSASLDYILQLISKYFYHPITKK